MPKALFGLAKEANSLDSMKKDMELLYQCIREIPELQLCNSESGDQSQRKNQAV